MSRREMNLSAPEASARVLCGKGQAESYVGVEITIS